MLSGVFPSQSLYAHSNCTKVLVVCVVHRLGQIVSLCCVLFILVLLLCVERNFFLLSSLVSSHKKHAQLAERVSTHRAVTTVITIIAVVRLFFRLGANDCSCPNFIGAWSPLSLVSSTSTVTKRFEKGEPSWPVWRFCEHPWTGLEKSFQ